MESKLSSTKLSGVVKSYRKKTTNTTQYLKSRTLMNINLNQALKVVPNTKIVEKSVQKVQKNGTTNRPSPPQVVPTIKSANPTTESLNVQRTRPKLSKWDFKGRLAYAEEDLIISKNNLKNATSRGNELAAELSELLEREKSSGDRAKRAEQLHHELIEERDSLVCEKKNNQEKVKSLKKDVDGLSSELAETLEKLKEFKENYESHDSKMSKLFDEIERVKEENSSHEETIVSLKNHNIELEIALDGIQEKRQEMLDTIRLLKGDD